MSTGLSGTQAADMSAWDLNRPENKVMDYIRGPTRQSQAKEIFFCVLMAQVVSRHEGVVSAGLLGCAHCQNMGQLSDPCLGLSPIWEASQGSGSGDKYEVLDMVHGNW